MTRWSVLTAVHDPDPEHLRACLTSVRRQRVRDVEHVVVDDGSTRPDVRAELDEAASARRIRLVRRSERGGIVAASQAALDAATGDYVALLDHDDVLAPDALASMGRALDGGAVLAYSDHDTILADGRRAAPYFKPDFSPEQLRNQNYVLHLVTARRRAVVDVGGFRAGLDGAQDHDLLLRLTERHRDAVAHVPRVLYHWRQAPGSVALDPASKPWAYDAGQRAVADHCERVGIVASVEPGRFAGTNRIDRYLAETPRVSVIVPTRGSVRDVWGVPRCFVVEAVRSLAERSTYPDLEFVVVHDDVTPDPVLAAIERAAPGRVRFVPFAEPFNFSRKINLGAAHATGDLLLLLNDDTELIEPRSVEVMVALALEPDVGMVGPKLLFADGTVQDAGHVYNHHLLPALVGWHGDGPGPWQLRPLGVAREVSGVTAAAALLRREVFDEIDGFDESMPVNFNDVDASLRIRATGRRIIWTPHASWHHFESQTRRPEASDEEFEAIRRRWAYEIEHDPYYNPNLAPYRSDWLERPWRAGAPLVEAETGAVEWFHHRFMEYVRRKTGRVHP